MSNLVLPHKKLRTSFRTSYETHNYCGSERKWYLKVETPGRYCPNLNCGRVLRKNPRFVKTEYTEENSY